LWRPLCILPHLYPPLYEKLREEGFVPDDLDRVLSTLPLKEYRRRSQRLYTLNDPFIVDFSAKHKGTHFFYITEKGIGRMPFFNTFADFRDRPLGCPYTGSALARFERSTLPEHEGIRTVVLRFLKIITPVKCVIPDYDGHICCPEEGELYQKTGPKTGPKRKARKVWSVNIDKLGGPRSIVPGLQLLWDV